MSYRLPTFNLTMNVWASGSGYPPNAGPPDYSGKPCQKYIHSRVYTDTSPGTWAEWVPAIVLRYPIDADFYPPYINSSVSYIECPAGELAYYRVRWVEIMHQGFPNEYWAAVCEQCFIDGSPWVPPVAQSTPFTFDYY